MILYIPRGMHFPANAPFAREMTASETPRLAPQRAIVSGRRPPARHGRAAAVQRHEECTRRRTSATVRF